MQNEQTTHLLQYEFRKFLRKIDHEDFLERFNSNTAAGLEYWKDGVCVVIAEPMMPKNKLSPWRLTFDNKRFDLTIPRMH